jgi:cobaltochelatase CobT
MFGKKGGRQEVEPNLSPYRAYTTRFDEEVSAASLLARLADNPAMRRITEGLRDEIMEPAGPRMKAVKRGVELQARLRRGHDLGDRPLVTLLIDHSGSMRGAKGLMAAVAADVAIDILRHEGIAFELLGFTTSAWRGGRARALWLRKGRPRDPGRLCDLLHIVYSDAERPSHVDRLLPLLLLPQVLKENVDGEALLWAYERAKRYAPTTWLCLLIGDGSPVDDSTILANGGAQTNWYLANHLLAVTELLQRDAKVRIGGLVLEGETPLPFDSFVEAAVLEDVPISLLTLLERVVWGKSEQRD